jgi:hypothetical protein
MKIVKDFSKKLKDPIYANKKIFKKEIWNVKGMLIGYSNQEFKFDVRPMFQMPNNQLGKKASTASKAEKIVFETDKDWVIVDVLELNTYIKKHKLKIVQLEDLISKLEWNIILPKK